MGGHDHPARSDEKNTVRRMPSRCARAFMTRTNASLAPGDMDRECQRGVVRGAEHHRVQEVLHGDALARPQSEGRARPVVASPEDGVRVDGDLVREPGALKAISAVTIFVRLAIGTGWSAAFSSSDVAGRQVGQEGGPRGERGGDGGVRRCRQRCRERRQAAVRRDRGRWRRIAVRRSEAT